MPTIRHDIDGLRAIAVLVVLLYHAGVSEISGGFVGVDVFFVISGYLIIPQIVSQMAEGRFTFGGFMARRIRRLVPALIPVLLYALVAGAVLLGSGAFAEFLESLLGASVFASNYVFLSQSGYFERTVDTLLLLHTWSLGVEFQFYLIAPVVMLLAGARKGAALALMALLSFALAVYLVSQASSWAFYGVLPRLWELTIGGLIGVAQGRLVMFARAALAMRVVGLALIILASVAYTSSQPFPGLAAALPVLGAALIIAAPGAARDPAHWFLSSRVMRWIGTRSYSLYLWHWPLIVTVALIAPKQNDLTNLLAVALAFPLAEASYRLVETPVRQRAFWKPAGRVAALLAAPVLALGALWAAEHQAGALSGMRAALPMDGVRVINDLGDAARADYLDKMRRDGVDGRAGICSLDEYGATPDALPCLLAARRGDPILVIGDSHARDIFHALSMGMPDQHFLLLHQSSCAPAEYAPSGNETCFAGLTDALPDLVDDVAPRVVVLASHWPLAAIPELEATLARLSGLDAPTILFGAGPVFKTSAVGLLRQAGMSGAALSPDTRLPARFKFDVRAADAAVRDVAARTGAPFVNRYDVFCGDAGCRAFLPDGELALMFWDRQHLSLPAMAWYGRTLANDPAFAPYRRD